MTPWAEPYRLRPAGLAESGLQADSSARGTLTRALSRAAGEHRPVLRHGLDRHPGVDPLERRSSDGSAEVVCGGATAEELGREGAGRVISSSPRARDEDGARGAADRR